MRVKRDNAQRERRKRDNTHKEREARTERRRDNTQGEEETAHTERDKGLDKLHKYRLSPDNKLCAICGLDNTGIYGIM